MSWWKNDWREYVLGANHDGREYVRNSECTYIVYFKMGCFYFFLFEICLQGKELDFYILLFSFVFFFFIYIKKNVNN